MDEKIKDGLTEQTILPELPKPPEKPEVPEEGFVPYAAEAAKKSGSGIRKVTILVLLILLALVGVIVIVFGKTFNFYQKTIGTLSFDYRNGEAVSDPIEDVTVSYAAELAERCRSSQVNATIVHYQFDEQENLSDTVTRYEYAYNVNEARARIEKGTASWYGAKEQTVRKTANGYEVQEGGRWVESSNAYLPPLFTYLFEVGETANRKFEWYQSVDSTVNGKIYNCEIWLLTDTSSGEPVYLTLYRYYQGEKLCAVRILNNLDTTTQVYDVQSYSIS